MKFLQLLRPTLCVAILLAPILSFGAGLKKKWVYCPTNLQADENIPKLEAIFRRAAAAGYNGVLLADTKFARLGELGDNGPRYFRNAERIKRAAAENHLEIIPAVFPIGYSEALLFHDPNLAEALPVRDALFVVQNGTARPVTEPPAALRGGDFRNLKLWGFHDENMVADNGSIRVTNPNGKNARITQKLSLKPFREYHFSVRVKTQNFHGTPEVKLLTADGRGLNFANLGVKPTQDWTLHHVIFNSLDHEQATLYIGCWGGTTGSLAWKDAKLEEAGFVNLVRREGAPLKVTREDGTTLVEGKDFEPLHDPRMGAVPWKGSFDVWHTPPVLKTSQPNGTRLRASYFHSVTVNDGQAMICPSEPKTLELLRDEARRMHALWGAKGYMMSHDEIRVFNQCDACQRRHLDAGALLADNARACVKILREVNPGGDIYVWGDMFDPNHNAVDNYYLVRGSLAGSWEGLDKDVIIVAWNYPKRDVSLKWFADRGHRQLIAGYYDSPPENILKWLESAKKVDGVLGAMFTTWRGRYNDLEKFGALLNAAK